MVVGGITWVRQEGQRLAKMNQGQPAPSFLTQWEESDRT